ncbi:hypothetical protein A1Q2_03496 [Trichosporon asahii var. asahii CBS 8904]|uniref:Ubiquitin-like domain-containing protein n=1 Tax=Trichosporon asahii var. asahii (strain CBS 8904) TaxID=1220162 RepID=K1WM05_TRIAC|nr:hypothetical protein A1Q2_03496 [Trichosporon asahii var. asahii CBS 8904]
MSDSDSDSDDEFFTAKARTGLARPPIRDDSPIEVGDSEPSDDEGPHSDVELVETTTSSKTTNGKGKGKAKEVRRRVELTPPPETIRDPEKEARMRQSLLVRVRKPSITMRSRGFSTSQGRIVVALAETLNKPTSDIVLVHNGHRIFATNQSPIELGIGDQGQLKGYEKAIWRKVQDEEERKRRERIAAEMSPAPDADDGEAGSPAPVPASDDDGTAPLVEPPTEDTVEKIKFTVRGEEGNLRLQVRLSTTAGSICRHYCNKYGITGARADNMRLHFDGESFDPETEISEMDLEPGDLVDVN